MQMPYPGCHVQKKSPMRKYKPLSKDAKNSHNSYGRPKLALPGLQKNSRDT